MFLSVGAFDVVGSAVGSFVCPNGVGILLFDGIELGTVLDTIVGCALLVGNELGDQLGWDVGAIQSISS